ncbi:hypothetical protein [Sphingomonas sp. LHG3406-1]|uniref:hypothetical protein n=1 Tax=Sphingomonas sp. LHG3406-1 TaxID=2804617 RepID=UPI0026198711|nr:hypothetical protein [Sphingomonas sp. LHG3406-1]
MKPLRFFAAASLALVAAPASSHAPHVGPAGGQAIHWGAYHFEFVPGVGGSRILVYRASDKKPVPAVAMSATARLLSGGKLVNVRFRPGGGNQLIAPEARLSGDWTASVSFKLPGAAPTIRYSARDLATLRRAGAKG